MKGASEGDRDDSSEDKGGHDGMRCTSMTECILVSDAKPEADHVHVREKCELCEGNRRNKPEAQWSRGSPGRNIVRTRGRQSHNDVTDACHR